MGRGEAMEPGARGSIARIVVLPAPGDRRRGMLLAGQLRAPVALGRTGTRRRKREGDGATPVGRFRLVALLYRPDRVPRPRTALPVTAIRRDSGWCDDPADRAYNREVRLPYAASHERLWRSDHLYDLVAVIDFNQRPAVPGKGSAIFLHLARDGYAPTEGCVAVAPTTMRRLLPRLTPATVIDIR